MYERAGDSAVDEWTLSQALGGSAQDTFQAHWNTWITQDDFSQMAAAGLNHVRIPIGYWSVNPIGGEPYQYGALEYLDKAVGWARGVGLKVCVDIHGLPGSQNGFDNSGHRGAHNWGTGDTVSKSLDTVRALTSRYAGDTDTVTIINLVNEPLGDIDVIKQYYKDGFGAVRTVTGSMIANFNDAFKGINFWQGFGTSDGYNNIMLGVHYYQIFNSAQLQYTPDKHIEDACGGAPLLRAADKWTTVSEWCGALTDCAKYLNGRGFGARYDGTYSNGIGKIGSCDGKYQGQVADLSSDDKYNIGRYIEAQLDAYEAKTGWFYWTWKTESAPEWDMQDQLVGGLFPNPVTSRKYPGQCKA